MTILKKLCSALLITASATSFITAEPESFSQRADRYLQELRQKHRDDLEQQRKNLMDIFFTITCLTQEGWKKYVDDNRGRIIEDFGRRDLFTAQIPPNSRYAHLAHKLFKQTNLDPNKIKLFYDNRICTMACSPQAIYINTLFNNRRSDSDIEADMLHEIQHILFEDTIIRICLKQYLDDYRPMCEYNNSFMNLWNYFKENRADIFAALTSLDSAQACYQFYETLRPHQAYRECQTHQHDAQRVATFKDIYNQMLNCYTRAFIETRQAENRWKLWAKKHEPKFYAAISSLSLLALFFVE